jgi:hypothetical protein
MHNLARGTVVVSLLVYVLTSPRLANAGDPVKTNFEIMRSLTAQVADELVSGLPADSTARELWLIPSMRDERYDFIGDILMESLGAKGYRAHIPLPAAPPGLPDSTASGAVSNVVEAPAGLRLEFEATDFTLRYPKISRSYLIGGKEVTRSAGVRVQVKLVNPRNGLVVWMGEASRSYNDRFPYGAIAEVEQGLYMFTKPPRHSRNWGKIIEPVVVSGIIVGLIYLFFSNQSG